ncbi:hypothetical protein IAQ00_13735 [Pantoea ananatis]|uniref:hypothetical protein n=1 Tax=Pantoea ananas TaxID=553 RepID=UPI002079ABFB|nr:hypothetical protein [Pantoea ananatis]USL56774.1 hypothetical protein IAQ00_13735 [Pantoea ananatis]
MFIRKEFNQYDDFTLYFLYVTDEVRIETNGMEGLQIEDRNHNVTNIEDFTNYVNLEKDEYFNESLVHKYIDTIIEAVNVLYDHLEGNNND